MSLVSRGTDRATTTRTVETTISSSMAPAAAAAGATTTSTGATTLARPAGPATATMVLTEVRVDFNYISASLGYSLTL